MEERILIISNNFSLPEKEKYVFIEYSNKKLYKKEFKKEEIDYSIEYIKKLKFNDTFILLNENIKKIFIEKLESNLEELMIIPKIFTLTNKQTKINLNYTFYDYGEGNIEQIKNFILELMKKREIFKEEKKRIGNFSGKGQFNQNEQNNKRSFNCDTERLPEIFKPLLENNISSEEINKYNDWLHENYAENFIFDDNDKSFQLSETKNIPIELLSKYYINMYTVGDKFFMNL